MNFPSGFLNFDLCYWFFFLLLCLFTLAVTIGTFCLRLDQVIVKNIFGLNFFYCHSIFRAKHIVVLQKSRSWYNKKVRAALDVNERMQLHHHPYSLNSQRVRLALEEKGIDYTSFHVNPVTGKNMDAAFFRMNPSAKLPVFQNGAHIIFDTIEIILYVSVLPFFKVWTTFCFGMRKMRLLEFRQAIDCS